MALLASSFSRSLWPLLLLLLLACTLTRTNAQGASCTSETEAEICGSDSTCNVCDSNSTLSCIQECKCDGSNSFFSPSGLNNDCRLLTDPDPRCMEYDENCVYCGRDFEGPCQRCLDIITEDFICIARENCTGSLEISLHQEIGQTVGVCIVEESFPLWAIIAIIAAVVVLLVIIVVGLIVLLCFLERPYSRGQFDIDMTELELGGNDSKNGTLRTRRSNSFSFTFQSSPPDANSSVIHENQLYIDETDDANEEDDEVVFKYKLAKLRKESEVFLKMLNDMRKRARELPEDSPVADQYRNVMHDVTRVLYLLNKKPSNVKMPVDGPQLMRWADSILKRYLATQDLQDMENPQGSRVPGYMEGSSQNTEKFMEMLNSLRDYSETFLRMLNEMRRRLKELRPENPTAQNYRKISKEVTRVLDMLNKRPSCVEMPVDGIELVKKAERLLKSYLHSKGEMMGYPKSESGRLSDFGPEEDETDF